MNREHLFRDERWSQQRRLQATRRNTQLLQEVGDSLWPVFRLIEVQLTGSVEEPHYLKQDIE